jgi:fumarylacetoacetate (FAA) hydrolase family protein
MSNYLISDFLPVDLHQALLVGRVWRKDGPHEGPCVVVVRDSEVIDITETVNTTTDFFERSDMLTIARRARGRSLGPVKDLIEANFLRGPVPAVQMFAPCDLQAIKACGVTFAVSLIERVIEEFAAGDPSKASDIRSSINAIIGDDLSALEPGSSNALRLKSELQSRGAWSQYMEVGIGPDPEVFTKSQPMSAVGFGARVGLLAESVWNNPEPEIVLAVNSRGKIIGATLGNDVNLRDIEGRSALLLGKCKDNNGSCAIGPFVRCFDDTFTLDSVREARVSLRIEGADDDFLLEGVSHMTEISRDPASLVSHTYGQHHQYPDGFMLFLGTMFSPIADRDAPGSGFTHHLNDRVTISTPQIGSLVNTVGLSTEIDPWTFGVRALYRNLWGRGFYKPE